jgi:AraC family transcriptional regulator
VLKQVTTSGEWYNPVTVDESLISAAQYPKVLPVRPVLSATWSRFAAHVFDLQTGFRQTLAFSDLVLSMRFSGSCHLRQELSGRCSAGRSGPGSMQLVPSHLNVTWEAREVSRRSHSIALFVPDTIFARIIAEHWGAEPKCVEIMHQFLIRDPVIEGVLMRLTAEVRSGSLSGELYAESACEFLAQHILHSYSSLSTPPPSSGGLPGGRLKTVLDYIDDSLSRQITLRQLAELAGVSSRHFERTFRHMVGVPPYAYVLGRRVAVARGLLTSQPALTIQQIAAKTGFSTASHLAFAFRRQVGCSPTMFRRRNGFGED